MPDTFAVIDVGSNAMRFQLAAVEEIGAYEVVSQERTPVRLGHSVFETGFLDPVARAQALAAIAQYKRVASGHQVRTLRAVATSAMREAADGLAFVMEAAECGVPLEILSEQDEARLIGLGVASGLRDDVVLGLFVDIGGGSVDLAIGNRSTIFSTFSLPLGAVRLTEHFLKSDPPAVDEISGLKEHALKVLAPIAPEILPYETTEVFGSGGTFTTVAETLARLNHEPKPRSFTAVSRSRLDSFFSLIRRQDVIGRAAIIAGNGQRADIIVAGVAVMQVIMDSLEIDAVSVSSRGLRDGLMYDLLRSAYPDYSGPWTRVKK